MQLLLNRLSRNSLVLAYLETNAVFSIVTTIVIGTILILGSSSFLTMATGNSSWLVPLVISRTISVNSGAGFTIQATPYDFRKYLPVFQNMLTFKAPASSVNTTFVNKTATIVNQTTSEKTSTLLLTGAANGNRFRNQSLYSSHPYFIPPTYSDGLRNLTPSTTAPILPIHRTPLQAVISEVYQIVKHSVNGHDDTSTAG
jgi:hypothetical protein